MKDDEKSIFGQQYRVVAVEGDRLLVRGIVPTLRAARTLGLFDLKNQDKPCAGINGHILRTPRGEYLDTRGDCEV